MTWSFNMRRTAFLILAFAFSFSGAAFGTKAAKVQYRVFAPSGAGKSVFLKSGTRLQKYSVIDKGTTLGFDVVGPTKVKIRTRAEFRPDVAEVTYEGQVWEGDRLVDGRKVKVPTSKLTLPGQSMGIGNARDIIMKVPKGKHSYRLWLTSEMVDRYYVRFYQTKRPQKMPEYIMFRPYAFVKELSLTGGKVVTTYYLVDGNGGATLSIVGPTILQVYCRANFSKDVKGNSKYTLGVFEGGKQARVFEGTCKQAPKGVFKELPDMLPSTLQKFTLDVPAGKHIYELKKINSAAPSLSVRFKIMKKSLGKKP
jgi:hypothetical protein